MKRGLFINLVALFCAGAVCSGSVVYAAGKIEVADSVNHGWVGFDDHFLQDGGEAGIADLLEQDRKEESSKPPVSSEPVSSEPASSEPASSEPVSSEAASSKAGNSGSESLPESSAPNEGTNAVSSEPVPSKPASSEPASSEAVSSEQASSELVPSKPASSEPASSEEVSSEPVSSREEPSETESSEEESSETVSSEPVSSEESSDVGLPEEEPSSEISSSEASSEETSLPSEVDPELLNIMAGAVQREIVGTNTPPSSQYYEAYKAQAVAAHTYMEYHYQNTGKYPSMSYSTPDLKTVELVREVYSELIYYNGKVINATYHAASGGHTQNSGYVWMADLPYLAGVESAYDDYAKTTTLSYDKVESKLRENGFDVDSSAPQDWFDLANATYSDGGFIDQILVCGKTATGKKLREIFGANVLYSVKIDGIEFDGNSFRFSTRGYGHGVGLSQLGAKGYAANEGWGYQQILTHYYTGTTIR